MLWQSYTGVGPTGRATAPSNSPLSLHSLLPLPSVHAEAEEPRCHCRHELAELVCHHHRAFASFRPPKALLLLPLPRPPLSWANRAEVRAHFLFLSPSAMDIAHRSATVVMVGFTGASFRPSSPSYVPRACVKLVPSLEQHVVP
jgi:hypothetical protein